MMRTKQEEITRKYEPMSKTHTHIYLNNRVPSLIFPVLFMLKKKNFFPFISYKLKFSQMGFLKD